MNWKRGKGKAERNNDSFPDTREVTPRRGKETLQHLNLHKKPTEEWGSYLDNQNIGILQSHDNVFG